MRAGAVLVVSAGLLFLAFGVSVAHDLSGGPSRADPTVHTALSALSEVIEAAPLGAGGNEWTPSRPSARSNTPMAYDAQSDRMVLFGGRTSATNLSDDTWAYDLETNAWTNVTPATRPSPRESHAMAYDTQSDRIILFGGSIATSPYVSDETWAYDFNTNTWTSMGPTVKPPGRTESAMAYDVQSDRVVLFGGFRAGYLNDTWTYDFNTNAWTNMTSATRPSGRSRMAMAYDSQSNLTVLFGGSAATGFSDETWSYDQNANAWTYVRPPSEAHDWPAGRDNHAMAYDAQSDRVVLFGGSTQIGRSEETWSCNVDDTNPIGRGPWTNVTSAPRPSARSARSMAYDAQSDRMVLFGGRTETGRSDETWAYNLETTTWAKPGPQARIEHAMAYDARSDRTILFGGYAISGESLHDTWAYDLDRNGWLNMTGGTRPSGNEGAKMAYDSESNRTILFGGISGGTYYDETWSYDFNTNTWTNMNVAGPPARDLHAMAYDAESDRIILFGGYLPGSGENDETWAYDLNANTWTNMNPGQRPSPRYTSAMAYDAESDRVVLFGGITFAGTVFGDTWAYDFNTNAWTNMKPAPRPAGTAFHAMAYDTLSDRTVMFGGFTTGTGLSDETWSYDVNMNAWTNMSPAVKPAGRTEFAMAYDAQSDRTVMFGGATATGFSDETWWYHHPNYPSAARSLQAFAGNAQVTLAWLPPASDGDSPITAYRIYRGTSPGGESLLASVGAALTNVTDTGLTNGIPYYYQVTAINGIGEGPRSNEVSATPASPVSPTAPRSLQAAAGNVAVSLSWLAPLSDGGSAITNYNVYRGTASGALSLLTTVGNVLIFTDTSVMNGIPYYYQVSAVNAIGEGPRSNEASATPTSGPVPPTAPLSLQAAAGNAAVSLSWLAPASDGGSPITNYKLYRGTSSGALALVGTVANVLAYSETGLPNGVTYYYQVTAINGIGEGPRSNEALATPSTTADAADPTIAITSPSSGATLTSTSVIVSGTASDNVALQKVEVSTDGTNWVAVTGTSSWSGTLTLGEGPGTIYARATDTSGRTATASVSFAVSVPVTGQGIPTFVLIGAVVAVAAGIAVFLFWRRRRGKGEEEKPRT